MEITTANMNQSDTLVPKLFLGCCGYEARCIQHCREAGKALGNYSILFIFDYQTEGLHSYETNSKYIKALRHSDVRIVDSWDAYLTAVDAVIASEELIDVTVDITSFDRRKMGDIFLLLHHYQSVLQNSEIFYYPQKYSEPSLNLEVVSAFSPLSVGYLAERELAQAGTTLFAGAGFEYGKIIGALDLLEPEEVFCFRPNSNDDRFKTKIDIANNEFEFLSDYPNGMDRLVDYYIYDVPKLYEILRGLVDHDVGRRNVLLLPMGPKIFAFVCILLALQYKNKVMVWRYSTVDTEEPKTTSNAIASGEVIQFSFKF